MAHYRVYFTFYVRPKQRSDIKRLTFDDLRFDTLDEAYDEIMRATDAFKEKNKYRVNLDWYEVHAIK